MTGPWEKYATQPEGGPWEKYARQPQEPTSKPEAPGFMESVGVGISDPVLALGQIADWTGLSKLPGPRAMNLQRQKMQEAQRGLAQEATDYEARRTASGETGFDAGRLVGNIANPVSWMGAGTIARAATPAMRIIQGAKVGAVTAPLTTPASPEATGTDFAQEKAGQFLAGGAAGAAIPGLWEGAKAGGRAVANVVRPWLPGGVDREVGHLANKVASERAPEVRHALRKPETVVPGSYPTAGQAAVKAGSAEFSGLQKIAAETNPSLYEGRMGVAGQQEAAREAAIGRFAKTPGDLESAIAKRGEQADIDYAKAAPQLVRPDPDLRALMTRPSMEKVLARAKEIAEESGDKFRIGPDTPEKTILSDILDQYGNRVVQKIPGTIAKFPVGQLHYMKLAMDDLTEPSRALVSGGLSGNELRAVNDTKKLFVNWINSKSAAYNQARQNYAKASRPINQMQVGQELEKSLTTPLENRGRAAVFAQAVKNAPRTVEKATGRNRGTLEDMLDPNQLDAVNRVMTDLKRDAEFRRLATAGRQQAGKIVGEEMDPYKVPNPLLRPIMVLNNIMNRIEGKATAATKRRLGDVMREPELLAELMEKARPYERRAFVDAAMRYQAMAAGAAIGTD